MRRANQTPRRVMGLMEEFRVFTAQTNRNSKGGESGDTMDVAYLLMAYGDSSCNRELSQRRLSIESTGMSLLVFTQPSHLESFRNSDSSVSGLTARFLVIAPEVLSYTYSECQGLPDDANLVEKFCSELYMPPC